MKAFSFAFITHLKECPSCKVKRKKVKAFNFILSINPTNRLSFVPLLELFFFRENLIQQFVL